MLTVAPALCERKAEPQAIFTESFRDRLTEQDGYETSYVLDGNRQRLDSRNVDGFIASRSFTSSLSRRLIEPPHRHLHVLTPATTDSPHALGQVMIATKDH